MAVSAGYVWSRFSAIGVSAATFSALGISRLDTILVILAIVHVLSVANSGNRKDSVTVKQKARAIRNPRWSSDDIRSQDLQVAIQSLQSAIRRVSTGNLAPQMSNQHRQLSTASEYRK